MLLSSLLKNMEFSLVKGNLDVEIANVTSDSREVANNGLFVAIPGFVVDGHSFINKAIDKGATAVIVDRDITISNDITVIRVNNCRLALASVSAQFYGEPTKNLHLVGITGTNGKTSTSYFLKSIFEEANKAIGVIGTMGTIMGDKVLQNKNTTPESSEVQKLMKSMIDEGIDQCVMEVSSHALELNRVAECNFNIGIFTNLTPDHLELHKSMEEYFLAKAKLFDLTNDYNIINMDDEYGAKLIKMVEGQTTKLITFGLSEQADFYPSDIQYEFDHTRFILNTPEGKKHIKVNLPGEIYVYNSLAAIASAYCSGIDLETIRKGIDKVDGIKGRMEVIYKRGDYSVIVDFSHTEDALEKALTTIRPYVKGKLILVFGVYADASPNGKKKREGMAKVASQFADFSIVTSDNPKNYDPYLIIREISEAMVRNNGNYKAILNREEAIQYAVEVSEENDIILIAGKGHETSQIIGGKEIPFNETEIVMEALKSRMKVAGAFR
ncbi:UDP-N-acetylmuramoyl-L-alanyl-D-glutamate--2,6-diaminopimelate ligase [Paucisalibacillus globulus]|uniref:UDP-N-acetylmuramoyl-L-alanyl-D-glutamate--2, 6-diaminopimelate ligase n=1 Tax=Paucisalibacillus globulus TaxID=351095 RepID=UPI00041A96A1|nr:UDP-N-acetylmuramoyl-L-alanyl-D-glutamate--2,6-diaminopimelate ligase [Paucisalibacillus globulus]